MKIAVAFSQNFVSQNYGRCEGFKIFEIDKYNNIINTKTIMNSFIKGCEMATLLSAYNVEIIIVGGIGASATDNLNKNGIKVIANIDGEISQVIEKFCRSL